MKIFHIISISFIIIVLLFVVSCQSKEVKELPIIPQDKMIRILRDIHIAEGNLQGNIETAKDSLGQIYYHHIFKKHQIKEVDFYQSYHAYTETPKIIENIYDSVSIEIQRVKIN